MTGILQACGRLMRRLRLLRIMLTGLVLLSAAPFVVTYLGYAPSLETILEMRGTLDIHAVGLAGIRFMVYLVLIWQGPLWSGIRPENIDRARLALCGACAAFELVLVQHVLDILFVPGVV